MIVVADTGAILGLIDAGDRHHAELLDAYEAVERSWILPWAILPEVDYLVATRIGADAQAAWLEDLASGAFAVEWGRDTDLERARQICRTHGALKIGLVDAAVIATAERLNADVIATLDLRDFSAVQIAGSPALWPRDRKVPRRQRPKS